MDGPLTLSLVIPARNEEASLETTVTELRNVLSAERIPAEILIVDDHSTDETPRIAQALAERFSDVRWLRNERPGGFGNAVAAGLDDFRGDAVCVVMADASDDPRDVVTYYRKLGEGYECVFGSRFIRGARVGGYPLHKLILNRVANAFVRVLFRLDLNDTTNAFKCYRREVIAGVGPLLSRHFNLTVELPLKAIVRGYRYAIVPICWRGRSGGVSKLKIKEMGSRYLFIVLYVFLEKVLSRGDYRR
ncbi:MAG: glycosyltransferase family 2 protein [Thermoanaerobaculia bacterium]